MADLMQQVRRNAEDVKSFVGDLYGDWLADIKQKDLAAKEQKGTIEYPPIRTISVATGVREVPESQKIPSDENASSSNSKTSANATESAIEKEKGNLLFKKGSYNKAATCYGNAMKLDPTNPILPTNRAMAYLKLERYDDAEKDCTTALALDPKSVKALWRRGIARRELGRSDEARKDLELALVLEPSNKTIAGDLKAIDEKAKNQSNQQKPDIKPEVTNRAIGPSQLNAIKAPQFLTQQPLLANTPSSSKPRNTGKLNSSNGASDGPTQRFNRPSSRVKLPITSVDQKLEDSWLFTRSAVQPKTPITSTETETKIEGTPITSAELKIKETPIKSMEDRDRDPVLAPAAEHLQVDVAHASIGKAAIVEIIEVPENSNVEPKSTTSPKVAATVSKPSEQSVAAKASDSSKAGSRASSLAIDKPATTLYEFERAFKSLKKDKEAFYLYMKQFDPAQLCNIFKESFDSTYLSAFIDAVSSQYMEYESDTTIHEFLKNISRIPRFHLAAMFMTRKEKSVVTDIFKKLENSESLESKTDLGQLRKAFNV
ncbi:hypothetical protein BJ742DRAFT_830657 [Cladochytrium replicatum]|nr:hypothetical protein BJ742DRAFT_830657 [Cladochytrium replicatum]